MTIAGPVRRQRLRLAARVSLVTGMAVLGTGLLATPALTQVLGQWSQHRVATERDAGTQRYARGLGTAYHTVSSDFEESIVSFEYGALPTRVDGTIVGLDPAPVPTSPVIEAGGAAGPVGSTVPGEVDRSPTSEPPAAAAGMLIRIPAIGLNQAVVEGVDREQLRLGPGHYPGTPVPGFLGNSVISGHRTTYTRPFFDLDLLEPGDSILLDTPLGLVTYRVRSSYTVDPSDMSPLAATDTAVLTLTTCNPKGSAVERLIVVADLAGVPFDDQRSAA